MRQSPPSQTYSQAAGKAIKDTRLRASLRMIQDRIGKGTMATWASLPDQSLRTDAKAARMRTLENLDLVLERLATTIQARGGHIFFAADAEEARTYCLDVARRNNVRSVVKGKSMTSSEIGVDALLEANGIEVTETDLGEYIIQLAEDRPSHIIAPCIHMDRRQIAELFTKKLGIEYTEDPPTLTRAARKTLREKLLNADMGITGCNIACAETGHISLVSNEGNIRMSTTMPRVHVSLMGMERVTATLREHNMLLRLLTRGAAVQNISTYVSFIGGPRQPGETDGPEEFHLVIIDNGRSRILADPKYREVLACIRCGGCLNICPVYGRIGGHTYDSPYPGPIGAVVTPLLYGINERADLCRGETLCGACKDICPVGNDLPRMLSELRHALAYGDPDWHVTPVSTAERTAFRFWAWAIQHRAVYDMLLRTMRVVQKPFIKNGIIQRFPLGPAARWTKQRDLVPVASATFAERWKHGLVAGSQTPPASGAIQMPRHNDGADRIADHTPSASAPLPDAASDTRPPNGITSTQKVKE